MRVSAKVNDKEVVAGEPEDATTRLMLVRAAAHAIESSMATEGTHTMTIVVTAEDAAAIKQGRAGAMVQQLAQQFARNPASRPTPKKEPAAPSE